MPTALLLDSALSRPSPTVSGSLSSPTVVRHFVHKPENVFDCRHLRDAQKGLIFLVAPLKPWRLEKQRNPWQIVSPNAKGVAFVNLQSFASFSDVIIIDQRTRVIITHVQSHHPQPMCDSSSHALLTAAP